MPATERAMIEEQRERYINPYTDFGFKKLFGTAMNKELLISFLNALFKGKPTITNVSYTPNEQLGGYGGRRAVFDVFCDTDKGEKVIVEMQKTEQNYFKDRSVFYASFPIQDQGKRGSDWDFNLKSVYTVAVLNFIFPDNEYDPECYHHEVKLLDTTDHHVFYDKLTFIYLEMPKFNKTEDELDGMLDKWLFVLKNLSRLFERPKALQERVFEKLFKQAEIARFTPKEVMEYEESLKIYRDLKNSMDTSYSKGEAKKSLEIAQRMKAMGLDIDIIAKATQLSPEQIEKL